MTAGRRWGKTFAAGLYLLTIAQHGGACAWIAPTYKNARPLWRFCEATVNPQAVKINKSEREIVFPGGGRIGVYSADNDVGVRGEWFDLVVIDEAARVSETTYTDVVLPTIAQSDGRIVLISTPHGKNWFFKEFLKAQEAGAAWQRPTSENPLPAIRRAAVLAKERVSARAYQQEWLAQFVDDGSFFTNVVACATAEPQDKAQDGHTYSIGVDWARAAGGDYTVFTVLDATSKRVAAQERYNGMDFATQRACLTELWRRFGCPEILAEYNSMGGPLVEQLQLDGLPVTGFTTTAATKHELMSALEMAFDRKEIGILNDTTLIGELQAYEKKERMGLPAYSAPEGMHDDTVISLALAWWAVAHTGMSVLFEA